MRGVERQVVVTRQVHLPRVRGRRTASRRSKGGARSATAPARCAGRAGTWCSRSRARRATARGRQRQQRCARVRRARALGAQRGGHGARAGRGRRRRAAADAGARTRRAARRAGRRSLRHRPRAAASVVPPRRATTCICELPVAVHEAVLGARIDVPSLDGPVKLRIPPGTQAGQRFRVERPRRADAGGRTRRPGRSRSRLVLPATLDERSKELMREFGELNSDRRQDGTEQLRADSMAKRSAARRTT